MTAEILTTLPAVAKTVYANCKKCGTERHLKVLAHKTETSASVQCEVCGSKSTFKLAKPKKEKVVKVTKPSKLYDKNAGKKKAPVNRTKSMHDEEYTNLMGSTESEESLKYSMKGKFQMNEKIEHPKFGLGVVKNVQPEKIEVVFSDEVRLLVHNR